MHPFEHLVGSNLISLVPSERGKLRLLVALSGGADSVALLCALQANAATNAELPIEVCVGHVNHGLRGQEADDDQGFCEKLCAKYNLPLQVVKLDLPSGDCSEEALRGLRYKALADMAINLSISHVVTAHTLNDQAETLLFRICRGTSLRGLAGIKGVRPLGRGLKLLRPLLSSERLEVETYLGDIGQTWCTDLSNRDSKYTRNFLRHQIIPPLTERFSALGQNLEHLRRNIEQESDLLDLLTSEQISRLRQPGRRSQFIAIDGISQLHPALRARVLVALMRESDVEASFERVQRIEKLLTQIDVTNTLRERRFSIGGGQDVLLEGGGLTFAAQISPRPESELLRQRQAMEPLEVRLPEREPARLTIIPWLNKALKIEKLQSFAVVEASQFPHRQAHHCLIDLSRIGGKLEFRLRQEGDRIQPLGMIQSVRLKQYLHANKDAARVSLLMPLDPVAAQRLTPLLADEEEVLWVPGYGLSEKVKVGQSEMIYRLSLIELANGVSSVHDIC